VWSPESAAEKSKAIASATTEIPVPAPISKVTEPLAPPPVNPLPAVTPVMVPVPPTPAQLTFDK
jgi:hypothetical protein